MKKTKRALLLSCITMLMCLSMLVGSTFAWFTDTATTGVNSIQSGTLDIALEMKDENGDWVNAEGVPLSWIALDGNEDILWEPGATYVTTPVRVVNYSNLAIEIDLFVNGFQGDLKLLEAMEFMIVNASYALPESMGGKGYTWDQLSGRSLRVTGPGTTVGSDVLGKDTDCLSAQDFGLQADWSNMVDDWNFDGVIDADEYGPGVGEGKPLYDICIIARMKEEAGNEYQGLTLTGAGLTVVAKQYRYYESDSYGHEYDKDAEWPVVDAADLDDALAAAKPGDTIALTAGVTYELPATLPEGVNIDGNGATVTIPKDDNFSRLYIDGTTISDAVIEGTNIVTSGDITFIGCTFKGNMNNAVPSDNVVFTDCVFDADVHFASGSGAEVPGSNFVATNCVFNKMVTLADFENATFTGCEFYGNNWAGKNVITYVEVGVNTFTDCTFTTGIRAASGLTADDFVITGCNITIADVSNLS